jgi:DUF4097 and DUF4098 domain-containing protein YvlB
MRLSPRTLAVLFCLSASHAALAADNDISKINGAVRIEAGQRADDISTVNGAVEVGERAVVDKASAVNGSITLGGGAQAHTLSTVNGQVNLGPASRVSGEVSTTNGGIALQRGADVAGSVGNVNGHIALDAAHVAGGLRTVSGDITVGANSQVEGGILVDKSSGWSFGKQRVPQVVIGPHAVVKGSLEFRREVDLKVSDSAQIGPVTGATVRKFSGAQP